MRLTYKTFRLESCLMEFVNNRCTLPDDLVSVVYRDERGAGEWVLWYWDLEEASQ